MRDTSGASINAKNADRLKPDCSVYPIKAGRLSTAANPLLSFVALKACRCSSVSGKKRRATTRTASEASVRTAKSGLHPTHWITSAPTVVYEVETTDGEISSLENPAQLPPRNEIVSIREPIIEANRAEALERAIFDVLPEASASGTYELRGERFTLVSEEVAQEIELAS